MHPGWAENDGWVDGGEQRKLKALLKERSDYQTKKKKNKEMDV